MTIAIELAEVQIVAIAVISILMTFSRGVNFGLAAVLLLGVVLSRPTVLGLEFAKFGSSLVLIAAIGSGLHVLWQRQERAISVTPFVILALVWCWLFVRASVFHLSDVGVGWSDYPALGSSAAFFAPLMACIAVAWNQQVLDCVRRLFVGLCVVVSGLMGASVVLGLLVGFSTIKLGTIPISYEWSSGNDLLFPGSLVYGQSSGAGIPRLIGFGSEPGVGALFIGWSYFALPSDWRFRLWWQSVLVVGLLATQSTAGIGAFAVCLMMRELSVGRDRHIGLRVAMLVTASMGAWLAIANPDFGLIQKAAEGSSFSDRAAATGAGFAAAVNDPLQASTTAPNAGINLIAGTAVFGLPWTALMLAFVLSPFIHARRNDWQFYATALIALTLLSAQPFQDSTVFAFLVLITFYTACSPRRSGSGVAIPISNRFVNRRGHLSSTSV